MNKFESNLWTIGIILSNATIRLCTKAKKLFRWVKKRAKTTSKDESFDYEFFKIW